MATAPVRLQPRIADAAAMGDELKKGDAMSDLVRVGFLGSQFVSRAHAESFQRHVRGARLVAVASPNEKHAAEFAHEFGLEAHYTDYRRLLERKDVDVVAIGIPNDLHAQAVIAAAQAGKHVILEKPFSITLEEADRMIAACKSAGVKLMYAEELVFAPKHVRARQLVKEGALGRLFLIKQLEKHSGPHSDWFWNVDRAGGGVLMDMGCHGVEFARWMLDKPRALAVTARCANVAWPERTRGEDDSTLLIEFDGGATALIEDSWAFFGGMDDRMELLGTEGSVFCDLVHGNAMKTYSRTGYGYAMEKAGDTRGWSFTVFEEAWNYGFPQEMQHFIDCIRDGKEPMESGEDGREVLRILFAAYESAATGRRIALDGYRPAFPQRPVESWLRSRAAAAGDTA
jgi:myo-inositol 2-dehydrogenase/D-chiro-inositol 1-dehydrogenase